MSLLERIRRLRPRRAPSQLRWIVAPRRDGWTVYLQRETPIAEVVWSVDVDSPEEYARELDLAFDAGLLSPLGFYSAPLPSSIR